MLFERYEIQVKDNNKEYILTLYLDSDLYEFASEFGKKTILPSKQLEDEVKGFIEQKIPHLKIGLAKIMIGSMLIGSFVMGENSAEAHTTNSSSNSSVQIVLNGTPLSLSQEPVIINGTTYIPIRDVAEGLGAEVWWNGESQTVGIKKGDQQISFIVGSKVARVNEDRFPMPPARIIGNKTMVPVRFISEIFGLNVEWDNTNRKVILSSKGDFGVTTSSNQKPWTTTITHTVKQGDNAWDLSIQYGIPMLELLRTNNLSMNSTLQPGQELTIPVHHIPIKPTASENHGELLDWWTEAQYVFPIGSVAKVTDFETGRSFYIKRTIGANHADCEPYTAEDAAIIKEVWGGKYSWDTRAVIIEIDGRRIAASMSSMPHDIQYIKDNNFPGHFDIHFLNSTRHKDGRIDYDHQAQVKRASGTLFS